MIGGQIPEKSIEEWDKYKLVEAAQERSLSSAKSLFLDMKFVERIVEAERGDRHAKEELKQLKATMKTKDKEIKDFEDIVSDLKISEANAIKEKGKLERSN